MHSKSVRLSSPVLHIQSQAGQEITVDEVMEKVRRLKVARGVSVRTALVYDGHLSPRIEADHGFDVVIPADRLL